MGTGPADGNSGRREWIRDIISSVAENEGCDPLALTPPLAEVIDVDALQQLLQYSPSGVKVSFEYQEQRIDVGPGDHIAVRDVSAGD